MTEEISKKTVLILLLLTIIISGISTWVALENANQVQNIDKTDSDTAHLRVGINVPEYDYSTDSSSGQVVLNVLPSQ